MTTTLTTIIVAIISSSAMGALATLLSEAVRRRWKKSDDAELITPSRVDKMEEKLDAVVNSQKVITKERIRYLGLCYIGAKKITLDDKETLQKMHEAYEGLGGNGDLDTVMNEVDKLPVVDNWTSKSNA